VRHVGCGVEQLGVPVEVPHRHGEGDGRHPALDFGSGLVKVMTFHGAKGLTFDAVLLPRLLARDFPGRDEASLRRLLFVGVTRATGWVYLCTREDEPFPLLDRTGVLFGTPEVFVQHHGTQAPGSAPSASGPLPALPCYAFDPEAEPVGWM
jgi:hypothetical protein